MNIASAFPTEQTKTVKSAKEWVSTLAKFREPNPARSNFELLVTAVPFLALWAAAWVSLSVSYWLTLALSVPIAMFLLRLFTIQHDCGHGSLFKNRTASDWVGRVLGVVTLTPYDVWRRTHAIHHSSHGNLEKRGIGDIVTLTVAEYQALSPLWKLQYRAYRNPFFLFGFVPAYLFFIQQRFPVGLTKTPKYWVSAMLTNLALLAVLGTIYYFGGWAPILLIFVPQRSSPRRQACGSSTSSISSKKQHGTTTKTGICTMPRSTVARTISSLHGSTGSAPILRSTMYIISIRASRSIACQKCCAKMPNSARLTA